MTIEIKSIDELEEAANKLINYCQNLRIITFNGEMGAGKTTFIKALCRVLGVLGTVSSPTFSLVNSYKTKKGEEVYHFDFYRLKTEEEAYDIGCEEYFESGKLCLIEWASQIPSLLPERYVSVQIEVLENNHRLLTFAVID